MADWWWQGRILTDHGAQLLVWKLHVWARIARVGGAPTQPAVGLG